MKPLRIIFMGSPDFAVPSLEKIHESDHVIRAVVSNPDKRRGRRSEPSPTAVKKRALELGYPTLDAADVNSKDFIAELKKIPADLYVVVAFRILPPDVLEIPEIGSINLHASLLPKYRGAAPIHWAIINGEKETGCTVFFLDEKVDTGNIIGQVKTDIGLMETTGDLYERLKTVGADLLLESVNKIAENNYNLLPQNDALATPAPKLHKANTKVDFAKSSENVHNFIRGLNPFPVAWCMYGSKKMNIYESEPADVTNLSPGEMAVINNKLVVGCSEGSIQMKKLQLPGTKQLTAREFINGYDVDKKLN